MNNHLHGINLIQDLGVLRAQGPDAASFLHNQLTNDFLHLGPGQARLAGFCNAKGRLQASLIGLSAGPEEILLICHSSLLAATLKRLSMFVLRAKVKLSDASDAYRIWGLMGQAAQAILGQADSTPWQRHDSQWGMGIALYPGAMTARALLLAPTDCAPPPAQTLAPGLWEWADVRSGVATVSQAVFEAFVPQMLNYESLGGVNFKKGCYPGQEVVARSQFRGTLKRRAYLAWCNSPLKAGDEVFETGQDQPCGTVVQAATAPAGGCDAIVSMQVSAFDSGLVRLSSPHGEALQLEAMPYPLLADI